MAFCTLCGAIASEEDMTKHTCNPPEKGKVKIDGQLVDVNG